MTGTVCQRCHAATAGGWYCAGCFAEFTEALDAVCVIGGHDAPGDVWPRSGWAGLVTELEVTAARWTSTRTAAGRQRKSADTQLPVNRAAASAAARLSRILAAFSAELPGAAFVADNPRAHARHIADHADLIVRSGGHDLDLIITAVAEAIVLVDGPHDPQFAGTCGADTTDRRRTCPGLVFSDDGVTGVCRRCDTEWTNIEARRKRIMEWAAGALMTKPQIVDALETVHGVRVSDNRFRQWVFRGRHGQAGGIVSVGFNQAGAPLYRLGEAQSLIRRRERAA